ncbi:DUF2953 domain-containing protein [bacterium]|nr:MAG: DUF2953 domain-containing protein [bacterium]
MLLVLLIIFLLIILPLFLPVGGEVICEHNKHRFRIILAGIRFPVPTSTRKTAKRKQKIRKFRSIPETIEQFHASRETFFRLWEYYDGKLFSKLFRTFQRFRRTLHVRVHRLEIIIGTPDPAMTGMLYGAACSAAAALPKSIPIILISDFVKNESVLNYRISLTLLPIRILFELIRTTINLRLWAVWRIVRESWSPLQARRQHV